MTQPGPAASLADPEPASATGPPDPSPVTTLPTSAAPPRATPPRRVRDVAVVLVVAASLSAGTALDPLRIVAGLAAALALGFAAERTWGRGWVVSLAVGLVAAVVPWTVLAAAAVAGVGLALTRRALPLLALPWAAAMPTPKGALLAAILASGLGLAMLAFRRPRPANAGTLRGLAQAVGPAVGLGLLGVAVVSARLTTPPPVGAALAVGALAALAAAQVAAALVAWRALDGARVAVALGSLALSAGAPAAFLLVLPLRPALGATWLSLVCGLSALAGLATRGRPRPVAALLGLLLGAFAGLGMRALGDLATS